MLGSRWLALAIAFACTAAAVGSMARGATASGAERAPGPVLLHVESNQPGATLGNSVAGAGDVNGDGYDDPACAGYGMSDAAVS